jgi:hypothetical protein
MSDDTTYTETTTYPATEWVPAESATYDPYVSVVDTYSYDSTDWNAVAEVENAYVADYYEGMDTSWDLWYAATDAMVAGDTELANELTYASYAVQDVAETSWDASFQVDDAMATTTTVTDYEPWPEASIDATSTAAVVDTTATETV